MRKLLAIISILLTIAITTPVEPHSSSDDSMYALSKEEIILHQDLPNQH